METNNTISSQELEQMRAQIAILKNKLDKQTIVNDTHIRNSMKSKRSEMTRTIGITIFAGVLAIPYCIGVFCYMGLSPVFIAATGLMLAVCVWLTIKQQLTLKGLDFSQGKLLETVEELLGGYSTVTSSTNRKAPRPWPGCHAGIDSTVFATIRRYFESVSGNVIL